jgi:hypothetical protein
VGSGNMDDNMSETKRVGSTTSWSWLLIVSMALPALLNMAGYAPQKGFFSFNLIIAGAGFLLSGLLLWFVALPRAEPSSREESDRTIEWQRAIAGPFTLLGALIVGLGGALLIVPPDPGATNVTWAVFGLLMLFVLGTMMVRALRVFAVHPENE